MRNIEFRGKPKDKSACACAEDNGFVYGGIAFDGCTDETYITRWNSFGLGFIENIEVDPATVGQFTGLTDRNGKRICEGDIVRTKYGRLCYIGWFSSKEYNGFDLTPIVFDGNIDCPPPDKYDLYYSGNLEVVGNVYDNLDLMERTTFRSE